MLLSIPSNTKNVVTMDIAASLNKLSSTRSIPPNILGTLVILCELDILYMFRIYESHNLTIRSHYLSFPYFSKKIWQLMHQDLDDV